MEVHPKEEEFVSFFKESLEEGIEGISVIQKFGKSEELAIYANTLEEWDEMIGGEWIERESGCLAPQVELSDCF